MKPFLKIIEVGPRDGLQNESVPLSVQDRIRLINALSETGLSVIETGSFVSPTWVPQMADTGEVLEKITKHPRVLYPALVPNMRGYDDTLRAGAKTIAIFTAASETFCQKNINVSIHESLVKSGEVAAKALSDGLQVRGYISCVLGCPYEGYVPLQKVLDVAKSLRDMGCYEISLGDTLGVGTRSATQHLIHAALKILPAAQLAVHFHDTFGQALVNVAAALDLGIRAVDSSLLGLGGCPYAKGAKGNVATEEVLMLARGMGFDTGVDIQKFIQVGIDFAPLFPHKQKGPGAKPLEAFQKWGEGFYDVPGNR